MAHHPVLKTIARPDQAQFFGFMTGNGSSLCNGDQSSDGPRIKPRRRYYSFFAKLFNRRPGSPNL